MVIKMNNFKEGKEDISRVVQSRGEKVFQVILCIILIFLALICFVPFWYIICQSFSSNQAIQAGKVGLLPVGFNIESYVYVLKRAPFWKSIGMTLIRIGIGLPLNLFLMITAAYPLSKTNGKFKGRNVYVWIFFFTMLFNGGLIPTYVLISNLNMLDTIWALVLPVGINVFNMLLVLSFFRQIPQELEEAAAIDGASHWTTLWKIYVPISLPVLATVTLFSLIQHWNSWFDGLIYMTTDKYPLQTYLRNIIITFNIANLSPQEQKLLASFNEDALKSAQMVIGTLPILLVYPFLQKYFVSGITLGSVKG